MSCAFPFSANTKSVCGTFSAKSDYNRGLSCPPPVVIPCEDRGAPDGRCYDENLSIAYNPDASKKFTVTSTLFDENGPISDEDGYAIRDEDGNIVYAGDCTPIRDEESEVILTKST